MEPLVRASLALRALSRRGHGLFITCVLASYVVTGGMTGELGVLQGVAAGAWTVLLVLRIRRRLRETETHSLLDIEIGMLAALGLETALLRFDGGLDGRFSPALY